MAKRQVRVTEPAIYKAIISDEERGARLLARDNATIAQRLRFALSHPRTTQTVEIDLQTATALLSRVEQPEGRGGCRGRVSARSAAVRWVRIRLTHGR